MRKQRLEPTLVENTILTGDGFEKVFIRLQQQVVLREQSKSTLNNYIRRIAAICLHFGKLPQEISDGEITEYLTSLALSPKSPSRSNFKHMVYGLRYYFRLMGDNKRAIGLPSLKKDTRLPVILNQGELRQLFKAPTLLKHRIVLSLIYSAGLRSQEAINLKISDIDFERKTIHIRQSKYKKDRIVPLAEYMKKGLKKYLSVENPHIWLFNGKEPDGRYSVKGLSWVMRETGAICVLHTWGQNLSLHPHIHCIVPATGIDLKDKFKTIGEQGKYLYPEKMLNATFKGKMMQSLKARIRLKGVLTQHQSTINAAYKKQWVVDGEPSFASPEHVVKYLAQYTHRIAISNQRLLNVDQQQVTFMHKDYKDRAKKKPVTLSGVEFLRRFAMHILPHRFVKIRYYGIYGSRYKTLVKQLVEKR